MVDTYCTDCREKTTYAVAHRQPTCCVCANKLIAKPSPDYPEQKAEQRTEVQTVTTPELANLKHKKRR